jgi:hypothetical protein
MFVLTIQRGQDTILLCASDDLVKIHAKMKEEVLSFLSEVYGDDEDAFDWLMPVSDDMNFWSDEDEEYPTIFRVETVDLI